MRAKLWVAVAFAAAMGPLPAAAQLDSGPNFELPPTGSIFITDGIALSDVRIAFDAGFNFSAPYQLGFLETQSGANFINPALNIDVNTSGFSGGLGFDFKIDWDRFRPVDAHIDFGFGQQRGVGYAMNVPFPNGIGAPNVGNGVDQGAWNPANSTLTQADFLSDRTFASLDKGFGIPFADGVLPLGDGLPTIDWEASLLGGVQAGYLRERQQFSATAIDGGTSTVEYDTMIHGGYLGAYGGLGLSKGFDIPNTDLRFYEDLSFTLGFAHYMLGVTDTLTGTGNLVPGGGTQTATYNGHATVPTFNFGLGAGVDTGGFKAGVKTGVSSGTNAPIEIRRPTSSDLGPADYVVLATILNTYLLFSLTGSF